MKNCTIFCALVLLISCSVVDEWRLNHTVRDNKLKQAISVQPGIDSSAFINGTIIYSDSSYIYLCKAEKGYVMSYSKKTYGKDSVLLIWEGEAYIQELPITYLELDRQGFNLKKPAGEFPSFYILYGKNGQRKHALFMLQPSVTYKDPIVHIDYYRNGNMQRLVNTNNIIDSIFYFNRDGMIRKLIIKNGGSKKVEYKNPDSLWMYHARFRVYEDSALKDMIQMPFKSEPEIPDVFERGDSLRK